MSTIESNKKDFSAKGTISNPYTEEEYQQLLAEGKEVACYVEGRGFCAPAAMAPPTNPGSPSDSSDPSSVTPPPLEQVINLLMPSARQIYESYMHDENKNITVLFSDAIRSSATVAITGGNVTITISYCVEDHSAESAARLLAQELFHLYQTDSGITQSVDGNHSPIEFQEQVMLWITGGTGCGHQLGILSASFDTFIDTYVTSNDGRKYVDIIAFKSGISFYYPAFVQANPVGGPNLYGEDQELRYADNIADLNWEDVFSWYGITCLINAI